MNSDKLNIANKIISEQEKLINSFDRWVQLVKGKDLMKASEVVAEANKLRVNISELKKERDKLNKRLILN